MDNWRSYVIFLLFIVSTSNIDLFCLQAIRHQVREILPRCVSSPSPSPPPPSTWWMDGWMDRGATQWPSLHLIYMQIEGTQCSLEFSRVLVLRRNGPWNKREKKNRRKAAIRHQQRNRKILPWPCFSFLFLLSTTDDWLSEIRANIWTFGTQIVLTLKKIKWSW